MKADRQKKMDGSERFRPKVARTGLENPDTGPDCGLGAGSARGGEVGRWAAAEQRARMRREMGHTLFPQGGPNAL